MTKTPTQMTMTVAATGTIIFKSTQDGSPGKGESPLPLVPLPGSLRWVPDPVIRSENRYNKKHVVTFWERHRMPVVSEDTNDSDSNDDYSHSGYNWYYEVDVRKEVHD